MTNNTEQRLLVLGLPETGKSSFIQALDEVLKNPASQTALCADGLAHDRSYIQAGKSLFLAGEKLPRTDRQVDNPPVELWFKHPPTGRRARLYLPDEKGEVFRDQWVNRRWEKTYRESLEKIDGILLFVRADEKSRVDERLGLAAQIPSNSKEVQPFDLKKASAQAQVVDLLQFITEHSNVRLPLRLSVLISAWDTVGHEGDKRPQKPCQFLDREWALLAQYIRANPSLFIPQCFGVSAYGGTPGNLGALIDTPPHKRVRVVDANAQPTDITKPLLWLFQLT